MRTTTPTVWRAWPTGVATLDLDGGIRLDTPAWFAWLAAPTTTSFSYPVDNPAQGYIEGFMTVCKERRTRGGVYWTAYWHVQRRLRKVYLGRTQTLTDARLQDVAAALLVQVLSAAAVGVAGDR